MEELAAQGFDDIIDVRAPLEFAEDHLPGAISLPVLDDEERARVGTIYKQVSPFTAKKLGAALVARNAARHLEEALADRPGGWRPLVYCWRGGQRSGSFALILGQIGWRVETLKGGYKAWRSLVVRQVHDTPIAPPLFVLDGNTGTAKTALLARLEAMGHQVIDLEGLARHRGSLFGGMGGQPSQKAFESALAMQLARLDPSRPLIVEAESAKVGNLRVPAPLWTAMCRAPRIEVMAPLQARAAYLTGAYADITADPARLATVIAQLRPWHSREVIADWLALAEAGAFPPLALALMRDHYDPRYQKHRERSAVPKVTLQAESLDETSLDRLAQEIAAALPNP
nr:tRNA 2-selenouridine(34) synthase MnmH [Stagnihabitans tardus]